MALWLVADPSRAFRERLASRNELANHSVYVLRPPRPMSTLPVGRSEFAARAANDALPMRERVLAHARLASQVRMGSARFARAGLYVPHHERADRTDDVRRGPRHGSRS